MSIRNFPSPFTRKKLKLFLVLAGLRRAFIRNFATTTQPLNQLTSDNVPFVWSDTCATVLHAIKEQLIPQLILAFQRPDETFIVEVDASGSAAGGVLSQNGTDGFLHPIAYFSTAFQGSKHHWAVTTKDAIYYSIQYVRGKNNTEADLLSRNHNALLTQPDSFFDDKIYATYLSNASFSEQLFQEQESNSVLHSVKRSVEKGERLLHGRYSKPTSDRKRYFNQVRPSSHSGIFT